MTQPKIYDHAFDLAFSVRSSDLEGRATAIEIMSALKARVAYFESRHDELLEAVGLPFDTYEVNPEKTSIKVLEDKIILKTIDAGNIKSIEMFRSGYSSDVSIILRDSNLSRNAADDNKHIIPMASHYLRSLGYLGEDLKRASDSAQSVGAVTLLSNDEFKKWSISIGWIDYNVINMKVNKETNGMSANDVAELVRSLENKHLKSFGLAKELEDIANFTGDKMKSLENGDVHIQLMSCLRKARMYEAKLPPPVNPWVDGLDKITIKIAKNTIGVKV